MARHERLRTPRTAALAVLAWLAAAPAACAPAPVASEPVVHLPVTAANIAFDHLELAAPAGRPFAIDLTTREVAGIAHNVEVRTQGGDALFSGKTIDGMSRIEYVVGPLAAGDYIYLCTIHPIPSMTGTLRIR